MLPYFTEQPGNPSSTHPFGGVAQLVADEFVPVSIPRLVD